jgi:hypothetical protein
MARRLRCASANPSTFDDPQNGAARTVGTSRCSVSPLLDDRRGGRVSTTCGDSPQQQTSHRPVPSRPWGEWRRLGQATALPGCPRYGETRPVVHDAGIDQRRIWETGRAGRIVLDLTPSSAVELTRRHES